MSKPIPPLDLMFLLTETADSPKHVSALMTFDAPAGGAPALVRELVRTCRAAQPVAPFTYVPQFPLTGMPRWKEAASVDLTRHVHHLALPAGAGDDALLELVQRLHETVMDRSRPGFEMFFIEGLAGGGFAVFVRLHHAIVDGASAMALLLASMNDAAAARRVEPFFALQLAAPRARPPKGLLDRVVALQKTARSQTAAVAGLYFGLVKKGLGRLLGNGRAGSEPFTAARTPLNEPLRPSRSIATLSLPLAEMKAAGKAFGGTLNDVAVTVVDAGLQRYLADIGRPAAKPLVVMCPISLREPGDKEATTKVTAMFVPLGSAALPVAERMRATIAGAAAAKAELRRMSKDTAMLYAIAAFGLAEAEAGLAQRAPAPTRPLASFVLSNVPGSATPLYLGGARMTGMYPISAIAAGMGLNATLASYAGAMDFGFVGNGVALPRLAELARHTRDAFDELKAAAAALEPPAPAPAGAPAKAARPAQAAKPAGTAKPTARRRTAPKPARKAAAPQPASTARKTPKRTPR